jgi:hypothetical protein
MALTYSHISRQIQIARSGTITGLTPTSIRTRAQSGLGDNNFQNSIRGRLSWRPLSYQARHRAAWAFVHRLDACGAALLGSSEIGIRTASNSNSGACLAVPVHDAIVGVDLPETVKSKLSMPKTEGCPCVCRSVAIHAVNLSPSTTYDPVYASTVSPPVTLPSLSSTMPVPSPCGVLNQVE